MRNVDFGRQSEDYTTHRPGFPESFYTRLNSIIPLEGIDALDLATGPGVVANELAARGSTVTGIDISGELIEEAQHMALRRSLQGHTRFVVARAEETGLDAASFDLVTAGHCWHWFDSATVFSEVERVLRPGGVLAIAYYSYLARHSEIAGETERLILSFNPEWPMAGSTGIRAELIDEAIDEGFRFVETFCYDHPEPFSHEQWKGRMRTCNGVGSGELSPDEVLEFDRRLEEILTDRYPEPMSVPHRVWCVVARKSA